MTPLEALTELRDRTTKAYQELSRLSREANNVAEHERLRAKASGVGLVLSYIEDAMRDVR